MENLLTNRVRSAAQQSQKHLLIVEMLFSKSPLSSATSGGPAVAWLHPRLHRHQPSGDELVPPKFVRCSTSGGAVFGDGACKEVFR